MSGCLSCSGTKASVQNVLVFVKGAMVCVLWSILVCLSFDLAASWSAGMGTADFLGDLLKSQTGEFNSKDVDTQETIFEFVPYLIDATVAAMPLLWVVPVLVTWFCPGPDAPLAALSCVLAATVLIFLQSWLSAAMLVCDLVGAALAQRRCPFFQEMFCAATLVCDLVGAALAQRQCPFFQDFCAATMVCMDEWLCVLPEVFDFIMISMSCVMMPDRALGLLGLFVVPMDFEMVMEHVRMFVDFFMVSMDLQMVKDSVRMVFDFFVVPMDSEMVQDEAAAASKHIECKFHSSRSISNFLIESEGPLVFLDEKGKKKEEKGEGDQEKKDEKSTRGIMTPPLVSILIQGMDGRHLFVKIVTGIRVSALCVDLAKKTGLPMDAFYLTRQGKVLQNEDELWLETDERLCMRGRLRGGMEGDWTCQHCGRQGCWVTKVRCYRCGKSRYDPPAQQMDGSPNVPGWIRTQARQQTEREWAQATRGAGVGPGTSGQPLGSKTSPPPPQQNQRSQNQRQKTPAQSRAPSPGQEYQEHDALLAALHGLIPGSLWEQVRSSLPKPEVPLTERIMQVQNRLDEEKKAANSWKEAVKMREAALLEGRKTLADHMTKVEGLQAELSELETQFFTQRKEKEEQERKDESEKLAATQVDFEQVPLPEDVDMEDGRNGKKRRGVQVEPMTYEELEANILRTMDSNGKTPEDYAEMIQRVLAKKAQQRAECSESSKVSRLDIQEEENREEDMNL